MGMIGTLFGRTGLRACVSGVLACLLALAVLPAFAAETAKADGTAAGTVFENFITRSGDKLMDGDKEFRFIGVSAPTAHYNESPYKHFPTAFEMEDTVRALRQMGSTATRIYILPTRGGNLYAPRAVYIEGPGQFNEEGFRALDKFLELCNLYGIRVIIPFTDAHKFWGGIDGLVAFRGKTTAEFWTDAQLKQDFKDIIEYVLNRTNTYTGVKYKDDKAVLAWQLGNELELYRCADGTIQCQDAWASEMAAFIKSIDGNHLVMDGRDRNFSGILDDPNIDIVDGHYYALYDGTENLASIAAEDRELTRGKKALIISESGLADTEDLLDLYDEVIANGTSGALLWSMRGHREAGGSFTHNENAYKGVTFRSYHWPGFDSANDLDERELLAAVRERAYAIQGLEPPEIKLEGAPYLHRIDAAEAISWKGVTGAAYYALERAPSPEGPWTVLDGHVTDESSPPLYADAEAAADKGAEYFYRVRAFSPEGEPTDYSNVQRLVVRSLVDEFERMDLIASHTRGVVLREDEPERFEGDASRLTIMTSGEEEIVYRAPEGAYWSSFALTAYHRSYRDGQLTFFTSADGVSYSEYAPDIRRDGARVEYRGAALADIPLPDNTAYLKIRFAAGMNEENEVQLSRIRLTVNGMLEDGFDSGHPASSRTAGTDILQPAGGDLAAYRGDGALLVKTASGEESVTYTLPYEAQEATAWVYYPDADFTDSEVRWYAASADGDFAPIEVRREADGGSRYLVKYRTGALPAGTTRLKLVLPAGDPARSAAISQVNIRTWHGYSPDLTTDIPAHERGMLTLEVGETFSLKVWDRSGGGAVEVSAAADYETSDAGIAVAEGGVIEARAPGLAWIRAAYGGRGTLIPVSVVDPAAEPAELLLGAEAYQVGRSSAVPLKAAVVYSDGSVREATAETVFGTEDESVAIVDASGGLRGVKVGTTKVTASFRGLTAQADVEVTRPTSFGELFDPMEQFDLIYSRSSNVKFDTANTPLLFGDGSRLRRGAATNEYVVYRTPYPVKSFEMIAYKRNETSPYAHFKLFASADGETYTEVAMHFEDLGKQPDVTDSWVKLRYTADAFPDSAIYLKVQFIHPLDGPDEPYWNPQIGELRIAYAAVETLALSAERNELAVGEKMPLSVAISYTDDSTAEIAGRATYASSDPSVAAVDPATGELIAVGMGTATITASYGGISDSLDVHVRGSYAVKLDGLRGFAGNELASAADAKGFVRVRVNAERLADIAEDVSPQLVGEWRADGETEAVWTVAAPLSADRLSAVREISFLLPASAPSWSLRIYVEDSASGGRLSESIIIGGEESA